MNTIISAMHFSWTDIEDCFQKARRDLKLDGVELSFHEKFARPHCTREEIEAVPRAAAKYGLSVYAHIWENLAVLGEETARRKLAFWREVSEKAGVRGLVIHGGSYPDQRAGLARTADILEKEMPLFEQAGIRLLLENHYAYTYKNRQELFSEGWEFETLFDRVQSSALRFCFDTGHGHLTKNGTDLLRRLASHLAHVHLADNHGEQDDHCPYGEGTVPWEEYFDVLAEIAYDGTFCVEFPVREHRAPFLSCRNALQVYRNRLREKTKPPKESGK